MILMTLLRIRVWIEYGRIIVLLCCGTIALTMVLLPQGFFFLYSSWMEVDGFNSVVRNIVAYYMVDLGGVSLLY